MQRFALLVFLLVLGYTLSSCGQAGTSIAPTPAPTGTIPVTTSAVEDQSTLLAALQEAGATAEVIDSVDQTFFTPEGAIISLNGEDVQVFEYESGEAMEAEAALVAPDGGSIGTSMVSWIDTPHFYKSGRIIVLYVGSNPAVTELLERVMGPQFAGR